MKPHLGSDLSGFKLGYRINRYPFEGKASEMRKLSARLSVCLLLLHLFAAGAIAAEAVRVGAYQNPPKVFATPDGHTTGVFPEVLDNIAARRDWDIEYVHGTWQECLNRLRDGEIDLMVDVAISEERRKIYDFSEEPVLVNWGMAFSRKGLAIDTFLDMENRTVAVMRGSIHTEGRQGIKALMARFGVHCSFIEVDDYHDVLMLLDSKQADAGIVNRLFGALHGDAFEVSPTPIIFNPRVLAFATRKGSRRGARLLEQIDQSLAEAKQNPDSVYHQALAYYLGGGVREWKGQKQKYLRQLALGPAETHWIKAHPRIRFSVDPGFAPFEFLSREGEYRGMAADFLNLVARKTGLQFELIKHNSWSESVQAIRTREIDLLPCIGYSEERRQFLAFSEPYLKFARVIVTRMDSPVRGLRDLSERHVAVQADSSHHAFLKENATARQRLCLEYEQCLLDVSRGEVDAAVGNLAVTTHLIQELALTNVKLAGYASPEPQSLAYGVRKDWPELISIINLALKSVTMRQRNEILSKWLPLPRAASTGIDLSQEEREWLLMHPRIRVGWDRSWAPIEFATPDGTPQGISMEYLQAIEKVLGIQFDMGSATDWQTTYGRLKRREIDMSSCLAITPQRLEHLDFTDAYFTSQVVFFAREDMPYIRNISDLQGLRVAVVENYATDEWMSRDAPDLTLMRTKTMADAFAMLSRGEVDVFIGSVHPGNFYLSKHRHRDIKIAGETTYAYKLRMAARNDWPLFSGILQKALASLPEDDKTAFYRKWVWVEYEHGFDYTLAVKIVLGALAVIFVLVYWNRRLTTEVRRRKQAQAALAKSESALRCSYEDLKKLEGLKDNLTHMIVHDIRSPLMVISGALELLQEDQENSDKTYLNMARSGAQTVTNMAQALLDICRLESGKMPLNRVEIDLKAVAERAIRAVELQARVVDVRLVLSGKAVRGEADPDILHRVLLNLIGHAIKASSPGASVEVLTIDGGSQMGIMVRDFGCGIPKAFHDVLFDKFTTIESSGQQRTSVGLGLTFCKMAIEAHSGYIAVESEPGQGSTFCIHIPKRTPFDAAKQGNSHACRAQSAPDNRDEGDSGKDAADSSST
jgi:ABC-type amino acid transport substrate-binding protein/nitrogen-specific signal transduction histidine kinase